MKICLIRHGETDWNIIGKLQGREDIPLNKNGIKQINDVAKYLRHNNWKIIISSPLSRAIMSAKIISKEIGNIKIYEENDFIERDFGKASGMTIEERKANFTNDNWEGIEPMETLKNRTVTALMKYIKKYENNDILIISHGAAINSILAYLSENEIGSGKTVLKNACITLMEKTIDQIKIIFYNKTIDELINE